MISYSIGIEITYIISIVGVATCAFWRAALSKHQFQKVHVQNQNRLPKSKLNSYVEATHVALRRLNESNHIETAFKTIQFPEMSMGNDGSLRTISRFLLIYGLPHPVSPQVRLRRPSQASEHKQQLGRKAKTPRKGRLQRGKKKNSMFPGVSFVVT